MLPTSINGSFDLYLPVNLLLHFLQGDQSHRQHPKTIVNSVLRFDKQNNNSVRPSHYLVHLFALTPHYCNLKLHVRRRRTEQDFSYGRKLAY